MNKDTQITFFFIISYMVLLSAVMYHACLGPDTYYYWTWSRQLSLSYYDGPPMIAYALRLITALLTDSTIGLLSLGLITIASTSYFLYQSATVLFKNTRVGLFSVMVWLTAAVTLRHFFLLITYDTTLIIFWAATFYFFLKLLETQKARYYYVCGLTVGCMMLSKYTGILLCAALLMICACYPHYRFIFKNKHFYLMAFISTVLFSPVLIWNIQHDWASFSYQLHKGLDSDASHFSGVILYLKHTFINFNIYFVIGVFLLLRYGRSIFKSKPLALVTIPTLFVWFFFLLVSFKNVPTNGDSWNTECFFTGALLIGYYLASLPLKRWLIYLIFSFALLANITYLLLSRFPEFNPLPGWKNVYAAKALLSKVPEGFYENQIIYHDGQYWLSSFISYFLPGHPKVYSANFINGNQFYFWNTMEKPAITGQPIVLFSYHPIITDRHYQQCQLQMSIPYQQKNYFEKNREWVLYLYHCLYAK